MQKSLLWRITLPQGGPDSFLFGTMHVRDQRAFGGLEQANRYLLACDAFATEYDFSETDHALIAEALLLPPEQALDVALRPSHWKSLDRYAWRYLKFPALLLRTQHPIQVSALLTSCLLPEDAPCSLDETLWKIAGEAGKKRVGVESFEGQIATIRAIPFEQHLKNLVSLIHGFARQRKHLEKMMRWYQAGSLQKLHKAARKDASGMRKTLLFDRNESMTRAFLTIAREGPLFCAVGAGHLAGGKGMLRMLKLAGCTVKPVISPNQN